MKHLLTILCMSATVFSAVAVTPPALALSRATKPMRATDLVLEPVNLPESALKADLTCELGLWKNAAGQWQIYCRVTNKGKKESGPFTTRFIWRAYRKQWFADVSNVPMNLPAGTSQWLSFVDYPAFGPVPAPPLGDSWAAPYIPGYLFAFADIDNQVAETNELNNDADNG